MSQPLERLTSSPATPSLPLTSPSPPVPSHPFPSPVQAFYTHPVSLSLTSLLCFVLPPPFPSLPPLPLRFTGIHNQSPSSLSTVYPSFLIPSSPSLSFYSFLFFPSSLPFTNADPLYSHTPCPLLPCSAHTYYCFLTIICILFLSSLLIISFFLFLCLT